TLHDCSLTIAPSLLNKPNTLLIPEIVELVIDHVDIGRSLLKCACVNSLWNVTALWKLYRGSLTDRRYRTPDIGSLNYLLVASQKRFARNISFVKHLMLAPELPLKEDSGENDKFVSSETCRALHNREDSHNSLCDCEARILRITDLILPPPVEFLAIDDYYSDPLTDKVMEYPELENRPLDSEKLRDRFSNLKALTIYRSESENRNKKLCRMIQSCDLRYFRFEDSCLGKLIECLRRQQNLDALTLKRPPSLLFAIHMPISKEQLGDQSWLKLKALYLENVVPTWLGKQLPSFEKLQILSLQENIEGSGNTMINYDTGTMIAKCRNLQVLDVSFHAFGFDDPTGVKALLRIAHGCTLLRKLRAQHVCANTQLGLNDTTTFPSLIRALPHLEFLDLDWTFQIKGAWIQDVALHCPSLTILEMSQTLLQISIAQLEKAHPLEKLEIMELERINFDNPVNLMEQDKLSILVSEWRRVFPMLREIACPSDSNHLASSYLEDMNLLGSRSVEEVQEMLLSEDDDMEESSNEKEDSWGHIPFVPRRDDNSSLPLRLKLLESNRLWTRPECINVMQSMQGNVVNMWQTSFEIETIGWPVLLSMLLPMYTAFKLWCSTLTVEMKYDLALPRPLQTPDATAMDA
ncbi:hypothetical protein DPV78_000067, partial [Talaromyces pinophilus]